MEHDIRELEYDPTSQKQQDDADDFEEDNNENDDLSVQEHDEENNVVEDREKFQPQEQLIQLPISVQQTVDERATELLLDTVASPVAVSPQPTFQETSRFEPTQPDEKVGGERNPCPNKVQSNGVRNMYTKAMQVQIPDFNKTVETKGERRNSVTEELQKVPKKRVSNLIAMFNSGSAFESVPVTNNNNGYKMEYGVGKGPVAAVKVGDNFH